MYPFSGTKMYRSLLEAAKNSPLSGPFKTAQCEAKINENREIAAASVAGKLILQ